MRLRDWGLEITQVEESITMHIRTQRSVLQKKMQRLAQARAAVVESRTQEELAEALDQASEDLEQYAQDLRENFLEFEEELFQLEEGFLDRFAEEGRSRQAGEAKTHAGSPDAEGTPDAQSGQTAPSGVSIPSHRDEITELRDFISRHQGDPPPPRECREHLQRAKSLQKELHAQWQVENGRAATAEKQTAVDDLFEEAAELGTIIREIRSLARFGKNLAKESGVSTAPPPQPRVTHHEPAVSWGDREPRNPESGTAAPSGPEPEENAATAPRSEEERAGPFAVSPEQLEKYEEDYLQYRYLYVHLRKSAQNKKEIREAHKLGKLVQARRRELEQWRNTHRLPADPPPMISQVFSATTPDDTAVVGSDGERRTRRERKMARKMRDILRDLSENPGVPQTNSSLGDVNRRVFLTGGRINPRATGGRRNR